MNARLPKSTSAFETAPASHPTSPSGANVTNGRISACPNPTRGTIAYAPTPKPGGPPRVKELIRYLLENMQLDFQGDVTLETVRGFLREDDSREARKLLAKLIEDEGVDSMLITLADCLREYLQEGISEETVSEQLHIYADS